MVSTVPLVFVPRAPCFYLPFPLPRDHEDSGDENAVLWVTHADVLGEKWSPLLRIFRANELRALVFKRNDAYQLFSLASLFNERRLIKFCIKFDTGGCL